MKYALVLPEEKSPELVKETENNPFESNAAGLSEDQGTTEENQVRDILMKLPAVGGASGSQGMRVLLGGMRLAEGSLVPPVLPDQQVVLKVKSITSTALELMWVDKKPTNLPPKILTIPLDLGAKVRRQLPGQGTKGSPQAGMGTIRRNGLPVLGAPSEMARSPEVLPALPAMTATDEPPEKTVAAAEPPAESLPPAATPEAAPLPPPADLPQASVLRMLFGNHAPAGK
ncbi:MAG TPA: hypothetical protein VD994_18785 [Prosthecobacter sp.]|nr:hypothetical protein [Prosthecobacter sp.]